MSGGDRIQIIAIIGSIATVLFILELIRRRRLKEEYSLLWLLFGAILLVFSFWREGLTYLSQLVGISYPPSTLLLLLIAGIFSILVHYSIALSHLSNNNKRLIQEIGLLNLDLKLMQKPKEENSESDNNVQ
ncbi:MAG: DUF2304 domain-containing protein [Candidatus Kapabacteria bacterium]|nr:DUF2304 domain-containing protein [Candidatus Kapabacteria bacterium]